MTRSLDRQPVAEAPTIDACLGGLQVVVMYYPVTYYKTFFDTMTMSKESHILVRREYDS